MNAIHHLELWTHDLEDAFPSFNWLLDRLGFGLDRGDDWPQGRIWRHPGGFYLVLEQSPDVVGRSHDRHRPGLNHVAFSVPSRAVLDAVRDEAAAHDWQQLFADRYPHAGGEQQEALYLVNGQGFEAELVVVG
ncbi:VOC family protein [Arthrobacter sp. NPDC090010]|uniref:VOC family protein n=1 Tax=Arthrobacter sp. NPDC090010 TaxID=3363942 RepID=UPI00382C92C2